ncbi:hypothetical protein N665_0218s0011 [Sinapis alba]|nr:hypothetical protein N665_0218s0011 [Sinapis alba]
MLIRITIALLLFISVKLPQNSVGPLGQNCFLPDTIKDHASVVFNTYYQIYKNQGGSCDFKGAAEITDTDPSHGSCAFEFVPDSK